MKEEIYLLQFNSEVLAASRNLTILWHQMIARCTVDKLELPLPYATVRRRMLSEGKFIHAPRAGWEYRIIERQLIKKSGQRKMDFTQDTVVKQSTDRSIVTRDSHSVTNSEGQGC